MAIDWRQGPKRYLAVGVASVALLVGAAGTASADPHDAHPDDRPGQEVPDRSDGPNHERNEHKRGYAHWDDWYEGPEYESEDGETEYESGD